MPKHLEAVLTDEIQKCFQITSKDTFYACCNIALHYFQKHPEVKKIRRKNWEALFPEAPITPCSFLNNKNDSQPDYGIYALSREVIGRGNNGKVKFALRLDIPYSKIIAIKIVEETKNNIGLIQSEAVIGKQQGFFKETSLYREDAKKHYLIAEYEGIPLSIWLKDKSIHQNLEIRLRAAIQLSIRVNNLHVGSDSCPPTAHRDIKLDNILISDEGKITLIDFGFSTNDLNMQDPGCSGTPFYLPANLDNLKKETQKEELIKLAILTKQIGLLSMDCFALKRVLWMPRFNGPSPMSLLSDMSIASLPPKLLALLDTRDWSKSISRKDTASEIATQLILFFYNIDVNWAIPQNYQKQIMGIYSDPTMEKDSKIDSLKKLLQAISPTPIMGISQLPSSPLLSNSWHRQESSNRPSAVSLDDDDFIVLVESMSGSSISEDKSAKV